MGGGAAAANSESGEEGRDFGRNSGRLVAAAVEKPRSALYIQAMLRQTALLLALSLAAPALAASPALKALSGWKAGQWRASEIGGHPGALQCLRQPDAVLLAGRPNASCQFSVIQDDAGTGVVTYRCGDGRQGRTEIRRDTADLLTVDAQGVENGRPFASRTEWSHAGRC